MGVVVEAREKGGGVEMWRRGGGGFWVWRETEEKKKSASDEVGGCEGG